MDPLDIGRIVLGVILLVGGAELLVRGAASVATRAGLSSLVVGLTVVAAATSAPELAVTLGAVLDGETGLAIGNVVGSNIANILLILGASALIAPLVVRRVLVRMDVPYLIGLSILTLVFALDGGLSRLEGGILLLLLAAHTALALWLSRREADGLAAEAKDPPGRDPSQKPAAGSPAPGPGATPATPRAAAKGPWRVLLSAYRNPGVLVSILLVAVGVGLLVLGARVLVAGAVSIASAMGVSGLVIGLTVVAAGTSLPELATSIIAALRGERDIAVGNIVGSCIFNLGLVLGLPAVLAPGGGGLQIPGPAIALDIPLMIAASVALAPVAFTGYRVGRREGGLFLALYLAYVGFLVLDATRHEALDGFTTVMVALVLPLVLLTLVGTVAFDLGRRRERKAAAAGQDEEIDRAWRS